MSIPVWLGVWLTVAATGVWWSMPPRAKQARWAGLGLLFAGGIGATLTFGAPEGPFVPISLLWLFGGAALICGALMITCVNPVYSALWFSLATLAVCGLFLLQDAPFLAAASIIVYAGAIIVMFLFVIMLVHQSDPTAYNSRPHQPLLATAVSFVLLAALLTALKQPIPELPIPQTIAHTLSRPDKNLMPTAENQTGTNENPTRERGIVENATPEQPSSALANNAPTLVAAPEPRIGTMHGLGRSLFGNYLLAVEVAGTLLLVAAIGAIAIAPRKERGTL